MAQSKTYSSTATRLLFKADIKKAEIAGKTYSVGETIPNTRSSARKINDVGVAKHNNILFAIRDMVNGTLKAGYVDKTGPYLIETEGGYKALISLRYQNAGGVASIEKICVQTTADEAHSPQAFANFLMVFAMVDTSVLPDAIEAAQNSDILHNESAMGIFEDALYFNLKYCEQFKVNGKEADVEFEMYDDATFIDLGFAKVDGCQPIPVPDNMEYLTNASGVLPFFKDVPQAAKPAAPTVDAVADLYAKIKAGAYRKFDYRFPIDAKDFIPPLSYLEGYVPNKEFFTLLNLSYIQMCEAFGEPYGDVVPTMKSKASEMNPGNVLNALLFGPPGTGKSTMPRAVAAALGIPFRNVTCSPENDENSFNLQIMFGDNGDMKYFEQLFRVAYRQGGIIVCDEVNLARPDILQGVFSCALDDSYRIGNMRTDLDTPEGRGFAERAASTICVFTCNPGAAGTKLQNTAFYSRIATWIELNELSKNDLFAMVKASYKTVENDILESVYGVFTDLRKSLGEQMDEMKEYQDLISPRCFRYCVGQYMNGVVLADAIRSTMLRPLVCLVQEKGEDTFKEFKDKILTKLETKLAKGTMYNKRREVVLLA